LAQLGAVQVWRNSLSDQRQAIVNYRRALSLGGTVTLPELYEAAGAKLSFEADMLQMAVDLAEKTIDDLEAVF
jgi:oligoendopeptidase F